MSDFEIDPRGPATAIELGKTYVFYSDIPIEDFEDGPALTPAAQREIFEDYAARHPMRARFVLWLLAGHPFGKLLGIRR